MECLQYVKDNIANNPGVRVYFGKYDEDAGPGKEKGLTTVFFAPTKGGSHENPEEIENEKEEQIPIRTTHHMSLMLLARLKSKSAGSLTTSSPNVR